MSRSTHKPRISIEDVKNRWYDTYCRYMRLKRENGGFKALCPLHKEKTPSFSVFGEGAFRCFGCGASGGSVIDFIMLKEGLDFKKAMDFIIKQNNIVPTEKSVIIRAPIAKKDPTLIEANFCAFQKKHKDYWNKYLLPESYLNNRGVYAVCKLAFNKKIQDIDGHAVFAYYAEDINKYKILRIGENVEKEDKWRNSIPQGYLFYFPKEKVKDLWIAKSVKDALVLNYHFKLNAIATQNEDGIHLLQNNYERIESIADRKIVAFGNDMQGWHESLLLTEYTGWNYFNVPQYMEKYGANDVAAIIEHFGVEPLKQLLKRKKYI